MLNMDFYQSVKIGFVKRAQEVGICEEAALALFKEAGWLGDRWTDLKDNAYAGGLKMINNPVTHGLAAANPFGENVKGFGDYFTGIGDRYSQSQDDLNISRASHSADAAMRQWQQGDLDATQDWQNDAVEKGRWAQGVGAKSFLFDKINANNTAMNDEFNAEQARIQSDQAAQDAAYNRFDQLKPVPGATPQYNPKGIPGAPAINGFNPGPPQGMTPPQPPKPPMPGMQTGGLSTPTQPGGVQMSGGAGGIKLQPPQGMAGANSLGPPSFARKPYGIN